MTLDATILQINPRSMLVRDFATRDEILVNYQNASRFRTGENVRITYFGRMTFSIPPQITASSIRRLPNQGTSAPPAQSVPAQMTAVVIQRSQNSLLVRNTQNNQQMRVNYAFANHFCVGQRIVVRYDTIQLSNPPLVNAVDITPVC